MAEAIGSDVDLSQAALVEAVDRLEWTTAERRSDPGVHQQQFASVTPSQYTGLNSVR